MEPSTSPVTASPVTALSVTALPVSWHSAADESNSGPVWDPALGAPLVPGHLAWSRMWVGHHRETWLCWSVALWAPAVVKIVRPGWAPQWAHALDREARALSGLAHPAVPRLLHDGRESCLPHVALEYLDGPDLGESLRQDGPFPAQDTARLGVLLLGALRALHATGVAHLDVSLGNLLLADRRLRLIDFGASRPLGSRLSRREEVGTEGFTAPELDGFPGGPVTTGLDVYSVGALLTALLDPAGEGADDVTELVAPLMYSDPGRRSGTDLAMSSLVRCAGTGEGRPWPRWANRSLPPPPRRRRPRARQLGGEQAG
jgi:serine/threonine protein kinase